MKGFYESVVALSICLVVLVSARASLSWATAAYNLHLDKKPIHPQSGLQFGSMPRDYPSWSGVGFDKQMSKEIVEELGTKNYLSRWYVEKNPPAGSDPRAFELHLAYYTGKIDTVPHVPERCFVGGGMSQAGDSSPNTPVPIDFALLSINTEADEDLMGGVIYTARQRSEGNHAFVNLPVGVERLQMHVTPFVDSAGRRLWAGYFFVANGGTVSSADQVRTLAYQLTDDYAFYAKVQIMSEDVASAEELGELLADALDEMFADIMFRVPDWVEVKSGRYPVEAAASDGPDGSVDEGR